MKRPLNETEEKLTKKGVIRRKDEIVRLKERLEVNKVLRDIITPYNRKIEDANLDLIIKTSETDLKIAKIDLDKLRLDLKIGVEVKKIEAPTGVN